MKPPPDSPARHDPWAPRPAGGGSSSSNEPAKKQRTEPPSSSSTHAEASSSSSSSQPPPHQPQPPPDAGEPPRVPDLGEDAVFEILRRAEARTLAAAACVSQAWRQLAEDERLWEAACVREWAGLGFSPHQLRAVVLSLGGFRRLHAVYIRPLQRRGPDEAPRSQGRRPLGRDQVQLSLSLFSIGFFQNMPNLPLPKKDKGDGGDDKSGGGLCG